MPIEDNLHDRTAGGWIGSSLEGNLNHRSRIAGYLKQYSSTHLDKMMLRNGNIRFRSAQDEGTFQDGIAQLNSNLALLVHLCGGGPARGTEY